MKPNVYYSIYSNRGQVSCVWRVNQERHLISADGKVLGKDVYEMENHPPFEKVIECKTVKVDITKKKIVYVLVGKVMCNFFDGQNAVWFEFALSQSKEKLEIWKDLNCI